MRVKVGPDWFESTKENPIMVCLSDEDKEKISGMIPDNHRYAVFTEGGRYDDVDTRKIWMRA